MDCLRSLFTGSFERQLELLNDLAQTDNVTNKTRIYQALFLSIVDEPFKNISSKHTNYVLQCLIKESDLHGEKKGFFPRLHVDLLRTAQLVMDVYIISHLSQDKPKKNLELIATATLLQTKITHLTESSNKGQIINLRILFNRQIELLNNNQPLFFHVYRKHCISVLEYSKNSADLSLEERADSGRILESFKRTPRILAWSSRGKWDQDHYNVVTYTFNRLMGDSESPALKNDPRRLASIAETRFNTCWYDMALLIRRLGEGMHYATNQLDKETFFAMAEELFNNKYSKLQDPVFGKRAITHLLSVKKHDSENDLINEISEPLFQKFKY